MTGIPFYSKIKWNLENYSILFTSDCCIGIKLDTEAFVVHVYEVWDDSKNALGESGIDSSALHNRSDAVESLYLVLRPLKPTGLCQFFYPWFVVVSHTSFAWFVGLLCLFVNELDCFNLFAVSIEIIFLLSS